MRSPRPPVAPYLTVSPAMAAIAFYGTVFGAKQRALMPAFDGLRIMHCELEINGGSVMLSDAFSEFGHTRVPLPANLRRSPSAWNMPRPRWSTISSRRPPVSAPRARRIL